MSDADRTDDTAAHTAPGPVPPSDPPQHAPGETTQPLGTGPQGTDPHTAPSPPSSAQPGYAPSAAQPPAGPYGAPPPGAPYGAQPGYAPYAPPTAYAPPGGYPAYGAPATRTNSMAIVSLVSSLLGLSAVPFIGSIVGIITGHMARRQIAETGEEGGGLATAGIIVGYVTVGLVALLVVLLVVAPLLFLGTFASMSGSW